MNSKTKRALEEAGFRVEADPGDFLGLTPAERAVVDARLALSRIVREARALSGQSQTQFADKMGTSQSRLAKIEAAAKGVSLDLMFKAAIAAGARFTVRKPRPPAKTASRAASPTRSVVRFEFAGAD